jgi:hypothetical protein
VLTGKVTKLLRKGAKQDAICDKCTDDRKDKPVLGLEIIRGAKKADGKEVWEDGKILDPEKGANYSLRLTPIDGGKKLEVRGYIGVWFGRTQTWVARPVSRPPGDTRPGRFRRMSPTPLTLSRAFRKPIPCPDSKSSKSPCSAQA